MSEPLGPWVRLEGIGIGQLPPGGKGIQPDTTIDSAAKSFDRSGSITAPSIKTFVTNVLYEAIPFIDGVAPKSQRAITSWKTKGGAKTFGGSKAPVHTYERTVSGKLIDGIVGMNQFTADRKDETWFCRRSCHRDAAENGTASWNEFFYSFKDHHSECEDAFTAAIIGAREAIRWDTSGLKVVVHNESWTNITVVVVEMKHKINPKPLKNRTFPVVQISAELAGTQEIVIVSIPLSDFDKSPYAEFAKDKSLVVAAYVAIERIRVMPSNGDIEWIMATASDAGGVLPCWVQNLAVPAQIAKDVDLFLSWIPTRRSDILKANSNNHLS